MTTYSEEETRAIGYALGVQVPESTVICFFGDLGVGKTSLIKGIVAGATGHSVEEVVSPTFAYLNIHFGIKTVYHFDLYRLHHGDEFLSMGFDDYFYAGGICCIEWSEKIEAFLPAGCLTIRMRHVNNSKREILFGDQIEVTFMDSKPSSFDLVEANKERTSSSAANAFLLSKNIKINLM